jgi:hypothetical protein
MDNPFNKKPNPEVQVLYVIANALVSIAQSLNALALDSAGITDEDRAKLKETTEQATASREALLAAIIGATNSPQ